MSRYQRAVFDLTGRIATIKPSDKFTRISIAVNNRGLDPENPTRWIDISTEYFNIDLDDEVLQAYAQKLSVGDMLTARGRLTTNLHTPGTPHPITGTRFLATFISAIPKRDADRLDSQAPEVTMQPEDHGQPAF